MPKYHPLDFLGWKLEIERLLDDKLYKENLEKIISNEFQQRSWSDFSKNFCDAFSLNLKSTTS